MNDSPVTPPPPAPAGPSVPNQQDDFNIAEEYGTARKNLPPAGIVAICVTVVLVIVAIYGFTTRARPQSSGTIDDVTTVAIQGQDMVLVAINISIQSHENKPAFIKSIQVSADLDDGNKISDDAVPAVDAQRYFQAFPGLKQNALNLLTLETKLNAGSTTTGTVVAGLAVKADAFAARKSIAVTITPYDELPVVMTK